MSSTAFHNMLRYFLVASASRPYRANSVTGWGRSHMDRCSPGLLVTASRPSEALSACQRMEVGSQSGVGEKRARL